MFGNTAETNAAERRPCEETAKANAEEGCEKAKTCKRKETACEEIAKGEWNAPQKRPCVRSDRAMAATRDRVREGCEKAKAGNRRPCARRAAERRPSGKTARANAGKDCEKAKAAARSAIWREKMFSAAAVKQAAGGDRRC